MEIKLKETSCYGCKTLAPEGLSVITAQWWCEVCKGANTELAKILHADFHDPNITAILYVSTEERNLDAISRYFKENVDMSDRRAIMTLGFPTALPHIPHTFDVIYCDNEAEHPKILSLLLKKNGIIKWVNKDNMTLYEKNNISLQS